MNSKIEQFIQSVHRHNPTAKTWRSYSSDLRLFASLTGEVSPNQITPKDIDRFVNIQVERGFKPTTINRHLGTVVSLYRFLGLSYPVRSHRHRLREPQRLARPLSGYELRCFFAVIHDPRDRAMFLLMRFCGLRIAEVAGLKMDDLRLPRLIVRGKGSRERTVYATNEVRQALDAWLDVRQAVESKFVFLSYQNQGLSTTAIHKHLMIYRQMAGISITAHRLRHSFATSLLAAGAPVTSIQKLMGHRRLNTTRSYILIEDQQVKNDYLSASSRIAGWKLEKKWRSSARTFSVRPGSTL